MNSKLLDEYLLDIQTLSEFVVIPSITLAYKIYKNYFTKEAKKCAGLPGKAKTICITDHRIKGYQKSVTHLKTLTSKCTKIKKIEKCKKLVQAKIEDYNKKIKKLKLIRKKYV